MFKSEMHCLYVGVVAATCATMERCHDFRRTIFTRVTHISRRVQLEIIVLPYIFNEELIRMEKEFKKESWNSGCKRNTPPRRGESYI